MLFHRLMGWTCHEENSILEEHLNMLQQDIKKKDSELEQHKQEVLRLDKLASDFAIKLDKLKLWDNPYGWKMHDPKYENYDGLTIRPNAFVTPHDIPLKAKARSLSKATIGSTASAFQNWINRYVKYTSDEQEHFEFGAEAFASKKADCDGMAILFQSMMHSCNYGDKSVVCVGMVTLPSGNRIGHAYNRVLISGEWKIFDANYGSKTKFNDYDRELYFFNYYNCFKGGQL